MLTLRGFDYFIRGLTLAQCSLNEKKLFMFFKIRNLRSNRFFIAILTFMLASNIAWAGGLTSVLKEVGRAEKKLNHLGVIDADETLTVNFTDGIHVHKKWEVESAVYFGEVGLLIHPHEYKKNQSSNLNNTVSVGYSNLFSVKKALKFYDKKPFRLEQMRASANCIDMQDRFKSPDLVSYSADLRTQEAESDLYDERGETLKKLKERGVKRATFSAVGFNPTQDSETFKILWATLKKKRKMVKSAFKKDRYFTKCIRLFDT